jgi:hypothetical protein
MHVLRQQPLVFVRAARKCGDQDQQREDRGLARDTKPIRRRLAGRLSEPSRGEWHRTILTARGARAGTSFGASNQNACDTCATHEICLARWDKYT